jgi:hypothetical protein
VAPVHAERAAKPLVGTRTLRGSGFELGARAIRGSSLLGKGPGHLMPTVASTVLRCGRAFSGAAAMRVVGDVGGRTLRPVTALRLPRRNDRARASASPLRSWWVPPVSDRAVCLQLMRAGRAIRGAWLHGSIKPRGRVRCVFTSTLSVCRPRPIRFRPRAVLAPSPSHSIRFALHAPLPVRMAPP